MSMKTKCRRDSRVTCIELPATNTEDSIRWPATELNRAFLPLTFVYFAAILFSLAALHSAFAAQTFSDTNWTAMGSGMDNSVLALGVSGSDLYAGSWFTTAGGKVLPYVARAYLERPTLSIFRSGGDVTISWPSFYGGFVLQQNTNVANTNSWSNAHYPLVTNGASKSATSPITPGNQFFRLIGN